MKRISDVQMPYRTQDGQPIAAKVSPQGVSCVLQFGDEWRVAPSDELQTALVQQLGAQEVEVEY